MNCRQIDEDFRPSVEQTASTDSILLSKSWWELGLDLSVRPRKCLIKLGINTIGELIQLSSNDLLAMPDFGNSSLNEVVLALSKIELKLKTWEENGCKHSEKVPKWRRGKFGYIRHLK